MLDQVPFYHRKNPSSHNFREVGEGESMRFTPLKTHHRIMEAVKLMKTNEISSSWKIESRLQDSRMSSKSRKSIEGEKSRGNIILPELNLKRHPKSYESIKNKILVGPLKHAKDVEREK